MTATNSESIAHKARINDLLEKLRSKLRTFAVISLQGQLIGHIKDFCLDKSRRLYMVISQASSQADAPVSLLSSRYIQKVDTAHRALFVDISPTEIKKMPVYRPSHDKRVEASGDLPRSPVSQTDSNGSSETLPQSETPPPKAEFYETEELEAPDDQSFTESDDMPEVVEEEIVRLLEERLVVNRGKRKLGEIVVRKEIETRIIEVPIQREKLIIEQVGSETKQLAEIDLWQGEVSGVELRDVQSQETPHSEVPSSDTPYTVTGEFLSPKAASNLLEAIALQKRHGCAKVRVELVLESPELQETYQKMFDRCSKR